MMGSDYQAIANNHSVVIQGCTGCSVYITIGAEMAQSSDEREFIGLYRRLTPTNKLRLIQAAADAEAMEGRELNGEHNVNDN